MQPLPDEKELSRLKSAVGSLILTSHRVRREASTLGASSVGSIMLDQVSFCGVESRSQPLLLVLAAVAALLGIAGVGGDDARLMLLGAAVVLAAIFFATRQSVVTVSSSGGRPSVTTRGLSRDSIEQSVSAVENARSGRGGTAA